MDLSRSPRRSVSGESRSISIDRYHGVEMFEGAAVLADITKDIPPRSGPIALLRVFDEEVLREASHPPVGGWIRGAPREQPVQAHAQDQNRCGLVGFAGQAGDLVSVDEIEKCRRR